MEDIIDDENEKENDNKKDDDGYERVCYLCHRPESVAGKMINMPQNICICADCMQRAFNTMNDGNMDDLMKFGMPGIHFMNMSDF